MPATIKLGLFLTLVIVESNGHGSFQSYNSKARQASEKLDGPTTNSTHFQRLTNVGKVKGEATRVQYEPTWESLDSRPLPQWYDQSKIGIFIHWGVYSVPGVATEWFWWEWKEGEANNDAVQLMAKHRKPGATYQEFAPEFAAEFYDPVQWAELLQKSGARYVVLTSKHHDGFALWPSRYSYSWNAKDVGPHRDVVGELASAIRNNTDLHFGLYHSLYEWYNPMWMADKRNDFGTNEFVRSKILPELYELINTYRPDVLWSDGDWEAPDDYWQSRKFLAWLYNESPVKDSVVSNDRWGKNGMFCHHGGFWSCADRYNPGVLVPHKWENAFTIDKRSWGYMRKGQLKDYLTPEEIITTIVETVSCGGNALINVGPTSEGTIPPIMEERLLQLGEWLGVNGEAIYNTIPYSVQNDTLAPGVWYTMSADETKVYAMVTRYPGQSITLASAPRNDIQRVQMIGVERDLTWIEMPRGVRVNFPHPDKMKSKWVWTLVFQA